MPDTQISVGQETRRRRRYAFLGGSWLKRTISWRVDRYPVLSKVTRQQVEETITEAFRLDCIYKSCGAAPFFGGSGCQWSQISGS